MVSTDGRAGARSTSSIYRTRSAQPEICATLTIIDRLSVRTLVLGQRHATSLPSVRVVGSCCRFSIRLRGAFHMLAGANPLLLVVCLLNLGWHFIVDSVIFALVTIISTYITRIVKSNQVKLVLECFWFLKLRQSCKLCLSHSRLTLHLNFDLNKVVARAFGAPASSL